MAVIIANYICLNGGEKKKLCKTYCFFSLMVCRNKLWERCSQVLFVLLLIFQLFVSLFRSATPSG